MMISKHVSLEELTKSQTGERLGIDNFPSATEQAALKAVCENIVEKVRAHFGKPVYINSGYRCPALNAAVGGAGNSQHCKGEAIDMEIPGMANADLAKWVRDNLDFDQIILECYKPGVPASGWVHCSYKAEGGNRKDVLTASLVNGKMVYTPGINV
jgi:zinc D-Ala-D-Ala carboxypeptidase